MKDISDLDILDEREKLLYIQAMFSSDAQPFYCNTEQYEIIQSAIKKIEDNNKRQQGSIDKLLLQDKISQAKKLNQKNYFRNFNKK